MKVTGRLSRTADGRGVVRVEEVYATDAADLWDACTRPERLARWIAEVSGDLVPGGAFRARFTSGWEGEGRVEVCEPPHRLRVVTREDGSSEDTVIDALLTPRGEGTELRIEESGLPGDQLPAYGAGWQTHLADLADRLAGSEPRDFVARWGELIAAYRDLEVG